MNPYHSKCVMVQLSPYDCHAQQTDSDYHPAVFTYDILYVLCNRGEETGESISLSCSYLPLFGGYQREAPESITFSLFSLLTHTHPHARTTFTVPKRHVVFSWERRCWIFLFTVHPFLCLIFTQLNPGKEPQ